MKVTRKKAIELVGIKAVEAVEAETCVLTNRVGGNGPMHNDPYLEYAASIDVNYSDLTDEQVSNLPIDGCRLFAYYLIDSDWVESLPEDVDYEELVNWEVDCYEIRQLSVLGCDKIPNGCNSRSIEGGSE